VFVKKAGKTLAVCMMCVVYVVEFSCSIPNAPSAAATFAAIREILSSCCRFSPAFLCTYAEIAKVTIDLKAHVLTLAANTSLVLPA
jgi:hypothetical protein